MASTDTGAWKPVFCVLVLNHHHRGSGQYLTTVEHLDDSGLCLMDISQ